MKYTSVVNLDVGAILKRDDILHWIVILVTLYAAGNWLYSQNSMRVINEDQKLIQEEITEATEYIRVLQNQDPAPKVKDTWLRFTAAADYFGVKYSLIGNASATKIGMYTGPLTAWHLSIEGDPLNVLSFIHTVAPELPAYLYYYVVDSSNIEVKVSLVGNT